MGDKFKHFDEEGNLDETALGKPPTPLAHCSKPGCDATFKDHHWGAKKAQADGWFLQKNDDKWCPEHNPPWVAEWRAKQARKRT